VSCEEKARLARVYDAATFAFSEAVKELHLRIGTSAKEEYKRHERTSTEARVQSEQPDSLLSNTSPFIVANAGMCGLRERFGRGRESSTKGLD
jgi:hypothetical protein